MSKVIEISRKQKIGSGCYGAVYRISPRRVIKVFHTHFRKSEVEELIKDEVKGSYRKFNVPVLQVIDVIIGKKKTKGLLKRYIPCDAGYDECREFTRKNRIRQWDSHPGNIRKDSKGQLYIIDSQTNAITHL